MQSNTTVSIKVYLMAILDNYMFRPLLAIFRLSSRELKVLLYIYIVGTCGCFQANLRSYYIYIYSRTSTKYIVGPVYIVGP